MLLRYDNILPPKGLSEAVDSTWRRRRVVSSQGEESAGLKDARRQNDNVATRASFYTTASVGILH